MREISIHWADLEDTTIGKLINKKVNQRNAKATNTLKGFGIWAAIIYKQKDTVQQNIAHTQRKMRISSYKSKHEFTREFVENSAAEWTEENLPSDVEFIGLDDENFNPPYAITLLKNMDLLDLPVYSFEHDLTNVMHSYNKFWPLFDGLVKDADDDLLKEFENKCGELAICRTLAKAVIDCKISKKKCWSQIPTEVF